MTAAMRLVYGNQKKDYINHMINSEPRTGVLFTDFINQIVGKKARRMGETYQTAYRSLVLQLEAFSKANEADIFINSVNEDFLDDFIFYLQEKNYKQSYIKNLVSLVKSMANKAAKSGYLIDPSYNDVEVEDPEFFSIYLSMNDITRIYYYIGLTPKQERIRDLFVVGCLTALRYSDYSTLTSQDFHGDYIVKITKKTGKKVIIPVHDYIREIYKKYDGEISKGVSIQHFNSYIKMIARKIGFTENVTFTYTRGGKLHYETKQKWELVSSHTARRSAATNMYLTGRMKTYEIMQLTGHTTERSFFRYIKVTKEDTAKQISADAFFRK